jgi:omega-6 fatty acid desaturase (delta-12 desaturase)
LSIWAAGMITSLVIDNIYAAIYFAVVAGVAGSQMFVLGHDACHGNYTPDLRLNGVLGRIAFIPSMHNYTLWAYFHNGMHHNFTNLRGYDFVWTPLSPEEFSRMSRPRRCLEYFYRHPTGIGFALYYSMELWRRKLIWPPKTLPKGITRSAHWDIAVIAAGWVLVVAVAGLVWDVDFAQLLGRTLLFAGISLTITSWAIGFVVFFNHTHPGIKWYDSLTDWRKEFSHEAGTCHVTFSGIWWYVLPNIVMNHTLHHIDTLIPVRNLAAAEDYLIAQTGMRMFTWRWTPLRHYAILKRCGLFDYVRGRWVRFTWDRVFSGH